MTRAMPRRWRRLGAAVLLAAGALVGGCSNSVVESTWSPQGDKIAYLNDGALNVHDCATGRARALSVGEVAVLLPSWSPDGKLIAFYSATFGENGAVSLRAVQPETGDARTLAADLWPLPRAAAALQIEPGETAEEARLEAQGVSLCLANFFGGISWSPDGGRLVCMSGSAMGSGLVINTATGEQEALTDATHFAFAPSWSPDGKRIAYLRAEGPAQELCDPKVANEKDPRDGRLISLWLYDVGVRTSSKVCDLPKDGYALGTRPEWSEDSAEIGLILDDPQHEGRAIGCRVAATPGAALRKELLGLTPRAAWAPGLAGVAFVEDRETGAKVLLYRGVQPRTRRALGELPQAAPEEGVVAESDSSGQDCSLPTFSRDGRRIALVVGQSKARRPVVFDVP